MTHHPDLGLEQAHVDRAYADLAAIRERTEHAADATESAAQEVDAAIAEAHLDAGSAASPPTCPASLRAPRRRGRRHLVRRPPPRRGRPRRPGRRRLAGAGRPRPSTGRRRPTRSACAGAGGS